MEDSIAAFLGFLSAFVFRAAAVGFLVVNCTAILAFALTRRRRLVDHWTPRLVTANAVLVGAGLGIPLLAGLAKLGVHAIASLGGGFGLFK